MKSTVSPELLANCLADIESGKMTIEECVAAHPSVGEDLRSMLQVAQAIPPLPAVSPDPTYRIRGRVELIEAISASKPPVTNSLLRRWIDGLRQSTLVVNRRMGMPAIIIILVMVLTTAAGGGAVYASQDTVPGDTLYGVKTVVESVQVNLAGSDEAKAKTYADLSEKRVAEIDKSSHAGNPAAANAASEKFVDEITQMDQHLAQAAASGKDVSDTAVLLAEILARHERVLTVVEARTPDAAKVGLAKAAADKGITIVIARIDGASADEKQRDDSDARGKGRPNTPTTPTPGGAISSTITMSPTIVMSPTNAISPTIVVSMTQAISDVNNLANDSNVSGESFRGLLAKLDVAEAALGRGQTHVALNELNAFVNQLDAMNRSGHIGATNYNTLFAQYEALVTALNGTPKPPVAPHVTSSAEPTGTPTSVSSTATPTPTAGKEDKKDETPGQGHGVGRDKNDDTPTLNGTPTPTAQPNLNPGGKPVPGKERK